MKRPDGQRRQTLNLDDLPTPVREAVRTAKGRPVAVTLPRLGALEVPMPKGVKLQ